MQGCWINLLWGPGALAGLGRWVGESRGSGAWPSAVAPLLRGSDFSTAKWRGFGKRLARFPGMRNVVVRSRRVAAKLPGLNHSCTTWAAYLASLCLGFLVCVMGITTVPTPWGCGAGESIYMCKMLRNAYKSVLIVTEMFNKR